MIHGLTVDRFRVRSLDVDRKELTWVIADSSVDPRDFTFQVLRSESPEGRYAAICEPFEDRYLFVDSRIPAGDRNRKLWYRLRVTHKATSDTKDTAAASHTPDADLVAQFIRRSEQTLFTQVNARKCWLLKRRTFGPRCPSCWDPVAQKRTRAQCLDCFDTGFLRGYHDPIEVWVQIDPEGANKNQNAQQIKNENHTSARLTFYPNVSPSDVLVEMENKRWRVLQISTSQRLRAPIKQELTMFHIQETDIEYKIPINLDRALKDVQPSPPRMFTNPTDLYSAIDERVPNIFANYPTYPGNAPEE